MAVRDRLLIAVAVVVGLIEGAALGWLITTTAVGLVVLVLIAALWLGFVSDIPLLSDIAAFCLDLFLWPVRVLGYALIGAGEPGPLPLTVRAVFWLAVAAALVVVWWATDFRIGGAT